MEVILQNKFFYFYCYIKTVLLQKLWIHDAGWMQDLCWSIITLLYFFFFHYIVMYDEISSIAL